MTERRTDEARPGRLTDEQYRLIAENASDVVYQLGADGVLEWVSPSLTEVLGWDPGELVGTRPWSLVHPDDSELAARVMAESAALGSPRRLELRVRHKDGGFRWVAALGRPVTVDGAPAGFVVGLRGIDELVATRRSEAAERERLRATLDSLLDPHVVVRAVHGDDGTIVDFVYVDANPAALQDMGLSREELVGARMSEVLPQLRFQGSMRRYVAAIESGEPLVLDQFRYPRDDDADPDADPDADADGGAAGRAVDVRAVAVGDGLSVTWRDVTDRVRAAEALAASERNFRLIAENVSDVVLQSDATGTLVWASPSAASVLGRAVGELVGRPVAELIHPDDLPRVVEAQREALRSGETSGHVVARWRSGPDGWRWMADTGRVILAEDGTVLGGIDALRDVQDEVEAREALQRSEERFRSAMRDAGIGMCLAGPDGALLEVNPALCHFLGREEQDLLGRRFHDITHPDDLEADVALVAAVLAGERDRFRLAKRYLLPDGAVVHGDLTVTAVRGPAGEVDYFIGQIVDITEQVASRAALEESERRYRLLAENSSDVVLVTDRGIAQWLSPSVRDVLGWDPVSLIGTDLAPMLHPDDARHLDEWRQQASDGEPHRVRYRMRRADGAYLWMESVTHPNVDGAGVAHGWIANLRDVTAEVEAREGLARSEELFRLLTEEANDVIARVSAAREIEYVSPSVQALLGWTPEELVGTSYLALWHPDDLGPVPEDTSAVPAGVPLRFRGRVRHRDGTYRWVEVNARTVEDPDGGVGGVLVMRDIEEQVRAERDLATSEQRFRLAMESAPTGMAVVDLDRRFVEVNPALCRMAGREAEWLLHHRIPDILEPEDDALDIRLRAEVLSGRTSSATAEKRLVRADGSVLWVEHSVGLLRDDEGTPLSYVSQFVNVDDARRARDELHYLATHDPLTKLANRAELLTQMKRLMSFAPRTGRKLGVLFVDLDGLKAVNDTYGHAVGDRVLVEMSARMAAQVRSEDVVARIGGDEFVVLLTTIRDEAAVATVARKVQEATGGPYEIDGHTVDVSLSIGLAVAEPGEDPERAIEHADRALYRAKRSGRAQTLAFDPAVDTAR